MRYAVIENGKVVNCIEVSQAEKGKLVGMTLVESDTAAIGDGYADGEFTRPEDPAIDLQAALASIRFHRETGGVDFAGVRIDTSRDSQAMIGGAYAYTQRFQSKSIKFKTDAGFVELDATQMSALAEAVGNHVQNCFAIEAATADAIEAGTITTIEQIEEAFDG